MTTGPEQYTAAEGILADVNEQLWNGIADDKTAMQIAVAQVHATLALAAATAMVGGAEGMNDLDYEAWDAVCGVQEPDDKPYQMTNADVMSASELYEADRDAEFAMDAADDAAREASWSGIDVEYGGDREFDECDDDESEA